MTKESKYGAGQPALYRLDRDVLRVTVLENNSDDDEVAYRLRVDQVLNQSGNFFNVGKEFDCIKSKSGSVSSLWHLEDI